MRSKKLKFPKWKKKICKFNDKNLAWLRKLVRFMIPLLVLILLFIVIGEFSEEINSLVTFFNMEEIIALNYLGEFIHLHMFKVIIFDLIVILFFIVDLYFSFFISPTFKFFLRHNYLDILAIIPIGFFAETASVTTSSQKLTHVAADSGKVVKATKLSGILKVLTRIPRFFRILRLRDFFKKKRKH